MEWHALGGKRRPKNCTLSEEGIELIQAYADAHGLKFSRAIEGLALMSLRDSRMLGILALLRETIRVEIGQQYNRIAKLMAYTAVQAGTAKEAAQAIYWLTILQELDIYVEGLKPGEAPTVKGLSAQLGIAADAIGSEEAVALFKARVSHFRYRAVKGLRKPSEALADILLELQQEIAEADEKEIQATVQHLVS